MENDPWRGFATEAVMKNWFCLVALALCPSLTLAEDKAPDPRLGEAQQVLRRAYEAAAAITEPHPRAALLELIAREQLRADDVESAEKSAAALEPGPVREDTLSRAALARAAAGNPEAIRTWVREHPKERDGVYADLTGILSAAGDLTGALEAAGQIEDGAARSAALRDVVRAEAGAGRLETAARTAERISDTLARAGALLSIAAGHRGKSEREVAATLCKAAEKLARSSKDQARWLVLVEVAVETARAGQFPEALRIARAIRDIEPRLSISENYAVATGGIQGLKERALSQIALELALAGRFDEALKTADEVRDIEPRKYRRGNTTMVEAAVYGLRASVMCRIAQVRIKAGELAAAGKIIEQMPSATDADGFFKREALRSLAVAQARAGRAAEAQRLFARVSELPIDPYYQTDSLAGTAVSQVEAGDAAGAAETFRRAVELAQKAEEEERGPMLIAIAGAMRVAGDRPAAARTLQLARRAVEGIAPGQGRDEVLGEVATGLAEAGEMGGALETLDLIRSTSRAPVVGALAAEHAQGGAFREALRWVDARAAIDERAYGLLGVAQGLLAQVRPRPVPTKDWEWQP
jgi:tetratricopeptide (TPR) repeat protein